MRHSFGGLTKNRSHPLIPRQNERTKTIIDQSKTAASSASFLFGRDGLLSTQSLKNPNDKRAAIHYTRSATVRNPNQSQQRLPLAALRFRWNS
ncbi:hypothetical protein MJO28_002279 [Puccinia striiformis f. sp. tritici]|uniref:Uncharacterized protein n=2 Tax=Puccinia striiformis f. sp. tritici TaxID=168172 RepID=A0ACC0EYE0_9BASI|nr:hypothetical protein MJO28_002278 [Puccinia striiformis f. sp. tritici]KAI7961790.1 hypothetical protein MJO28_002279 [Puccinia striiformis f. sp. tritici]